MASLRLFYFIEKYCVKAKHNPMWKNYIRANKNDLDSNPQAVKDLIELLRSTSEYKRLMDLYNLGIYRDTKHQVENVAKRVGLKINHLPLTNNLKNP